MKRIEIQHTTQYGFSEAVRLGPHHLLIRPREGHDIRMESSRLSIQPTCKVKWLRDLYGNSVAVAKFDRPTSTLKVESRVLLQHYESEPLDFLVDEKAVTFPFHFNPKERLDLIPFQTLCFPSDTKVLQEWVKRFWKPGQVIETYALLDRINQCIAREFRYEMREEPGVKRPSETLRLKTGSCRDFATLFIEACRYFGLAARFVSGYLNCPATVQGHGSTHAWAEVYLPGAGWKGFDNTSGIVTGHDHIATAVNRHPEDVPPVSGSFFGNANIKSVMKVQVEVRELNPSNLQTTKPASS